MRLLVTLFEHVRGYQTWLRTIFCVYKTENKTFKSISRYLYFCVIFIYISYPPLSPSPKVTGDSEFKSRGLKGMSQDDIR